MRRFILFAGTVMPLLALAACGGGSAPVASTPTPPAAPAVVPPAPPPPPPPPPGSTPGPYDTTEYRRSNAAVQARALSAYLAGSTGAGVTVGVVDSGVDATSPEFAGRISSQSGDFTGAGRGLQDQGGHGTAVSSVLLGAKNDSGTHGVALDATLLVLRTDTPGTCTNPGIEDNEGCTHNDNAIAMGIDRAVAARARVVNVSLGGSPANGALRAAIDRATAAGIIIVFSAGNDSSPNPDSLAQIALDPVARGLILIAGATDGAQVSADFSNKAGNGAALYLTALGVRIRSIDQNGAAFLFSGTSFSAPVVSGAVALLAQAFPALSAAQIVDLLLRTTTDLGAPGTDPIYGRGELNLERAFQPQGGSSLAGSAVSLTNNAMLSAPMGDAGQGGLAATIRDGYGRDFTVDLGSTIARAPRASSLAPALAQGTRTLAARGGATTLALSIADGAPQDLLLKPDETNAARALAGSIATRIGRDTSLALGFAQGGEALSRSLAGSAEPAFLVSDRADGGRGFDRAPMGAFAVRQGIGGIGVTLAAESGDVRLWQQSEIGALGDGYRRYAYGSVSAALDGASGPFSATARLTRLTERDTVLGARFSPALGGGGATSWFADFSANLVPARDWRLGASLRQGWTQLAAGPARGGSTLTTRAMAFDIERSSLLAAGDSFALRWAQPLRVTSGGLDLNGFDQGAQLNLAPDGREQDIEAVYGRALGPGWLTTNLYWRRQPGNYERAPDDLGIALRYGFEF